MKFTKCFEAEVHQNDCVLLHYHKIHNPIFLIPLQGPKHLLENGYLCKMAIVL